MSKITVSFDCDDVEIAASLIAVYEVLTHKPHSDTLDSPFLAKEIVPTIMYLRDLLGWSSNKLDDYFTDFEREQFKKFMSFDK